MDIAYDEIPERHYKESEVREEGEVADLGDNKSAHGRRERRKKSTDNADEQRNK